jgi:hypothetical protein
VSADERVAAALCHEYHPMHWDVAYGNRSRPCQACRIHAAALGPVLAEMRAEAWDEGWATGMGDAAGLTNGTRDAVTDNPYRGGTP